MCTNFQIAAQDGAIVVGRSMEFGSNSPSFYVHGRDAQCPPMDHAAVRSFRGPTSRYGYVGISIQIPVVGRLPGVVDGINEHGLSAGCLWLPGSQYQAVTTPQRSMLVIHLTDLVLGQCRTIDDVLQLLPKYDFWLPEELAKLIPLHFPITDATGRSIVVEFEAGQLRIHENPVGVCTNAPWFPWHVTNLKNFVALTPHDPEPKTFGDLTLTATGHGGGFGALPGDYSPPTRFVRAFFLREAAIQHGLPADGPSAVNLSIHVLNTVDIPRFSILSALSQPHGLPDYTQWVVWKDLKNRAIGLRTYQTQRFQGIRLADIDFATVASHTVALPEVSETIYLEIPTTGLVSHRAKAAAI